jgi:hypothetical protein
MCFISSYVSVARFMLKIKSQYQYNNFLQHLMPNLCYGLMDRVSSMLMILKLFKLDLFLHP